jgi:hypothetical protein
MNYTLLAENTTKRHLRVELRATLALNNPELCFYEEDHVSTSRLHSLIVHDKRGKELEIRRIRHGAWRITAQKGTFVCISYLLHAFVMAPTETYVSRDTWIINPKSSLMTLEGMKETSPIVTLSSTDINVTFASQKEVQSDIEGYTLSFESTDEMYHTLIMGGSGISTYNLKNTKITIKGDIESLDLEKLYQSIESQFDGNELDTNASILVYIVPGHIEKRALEYGEQHVLNNTFIILPTSDRLEIELKEKIIYSIYYHMYSRISLYKEGRIVPWFVEGFSNWNAIQKMKSIWTKEEYRLRVERCYIRTFSLDRELRETVLDSGYNKTSTLSRDAGSVLCHQLSILCKEKENKRGPMIDIESKHSITESIGSYYSGDLIWLWSLSLYSSDLSGWLEVCKQYILIDGWTLECPKRGPIKVIYA